MFHNIQVIGEEETESFTYSIREASSNVDDHSQSSPALIVTNDSENLVSEQTANEIFAALDKVSGKPDYSSDVAAFSKRSESLPAPKSGNIVSHSFPVTDSDIHAPVASAESDPSGPLTILRFAPQGPQKTQLSHTSITFSQPMIPVTSIEDISKYQIPCSITADNDNGRYAKEHGSWRWIGTQMIKFEPHHGRRLPMSTHFEVSVLEDVKSIAGEQLAEPFSFCFDTPTVRALSAYPSSISSRSPKIFIRFDQRIEPKKVIPFIQLRVPGKTPIPLDLIEDMDALLENEEKELPPDDVSTQTDVPFMEYWRKSTSDHVERVRNQTPHQLCSLIRAAQAEGEKDLTPFEKETAGKNEQFFIVAQIGSDKATQRGLGEELLLPNDSQIEIVVQKGLPSAEGALVSCAEQSFSFRTYSALKVSTSNSDKELAPCDAFYFQFNNVLNSQLETLSDDQWKSLLSITPELDYSVTVSGSSLHIRGSTVGCTEYKVSLGGWLVDKYGQSFQNLPFEKSQEFTFKVGNARQFLRAHRDGMFIADPSTLSSPTFDVSTVNYHKLKVSLFRVTPRDFENSVWSRNGQRSKKAYNEQTPHELIGSVGTLVSEKIIDVDNYHDNQVVTTRIHISEALETPTTPSEVLFGHVCIVVDVVEEDHNNTDYNPWERRTRPTAWMQVTDLGVDIFHNQADLVSQCFVSSLRTGLPITGAQVTLRDATAQSDATGMLALPNTQNESRLSNQALFIEHESQTVIVPHVSPIRRFNACQVKFYVVDDRQLYKPGEEVHFKGFVRLFCFDAKSRSMKLRSFPPEACESTEITKAPFYITYRVRDSRRAEVIKALPLAIDSRTGGFHGSFTLPDQVNLGSATVQFSLEGVRNQANANKFFSDQFTVEQLGQVTMSSFNHVHNFKIEEFRRPEYQVSASRVDTSSGSPRHACFGDSEPVLIECDAQYYSGGPLNNASVEWRVSGTASTYTPPGVAHGYQFGTAGDSISQLFCRRITNRDTVRVENVELGVTEDEDLRTTPNGTHCVELDFTASHLITPRPILLHCEATINDINRQALAASTSVLIHPSLLYIGSKRSSYYVNLPEDCKGEKGDYFDFVVVDVDGNAVAGVALELVMKQGNAIIHEQVLISKRSKKGEPQTGSIRFDLYSKNFKFAEKLRSGPVTIEVSVTDNEGRRNVTSSSVYLMVESNGEMSYRAMQKNTGAMCPRDTVTLIPNKDIFDVGDTARVLVNSPWTKGKGQARSGVWSLWNQRSLIVSNRFDFAENSSSFEVEFDIKEEFIGNGSTVLAVDIVGEADRNIGEETPTRVAYGHQQLPLHVSVLSRQLTAEVKNEETARPGENTTVRVAVKDHAGNYVPDCSLCVFAVDEAVLALTGYTLPNPMDSFYETVNQHRTHANVQNNRSSVYIVNAGSISLEGQLGVPKPQRLTRGGSFGGGAANRFMCCAAVQESAPGARLDAMEGYDGGDMGEEPTVGEIKVRSNFNALAVWVPNGTTPSFTSSPPISFEQAHSEFTFPLPDSLTRYRIFCVAVSGSQLFGTGESSISASLPIQVKPSPPRFLNFGDESQISIVVRNQSNKPIKGACVVLRSLNSVVSLANSVPGIRVSIPPNDRLELRFGVSATENVGTARFQTAVVASESESDAAEFQFPVYTPATSEAFATYGELDDNEAIAIQNIQKPSPTEIWPQFGDLSVSVSSTALQSLVDAYLYVYHYKFDCTEQIASRILSSVSMRDVIAAFSQVEQTGSSPPPSQEEITRQVQQDLLQLQKRQDPQTGGFGFWNTNNISPFASIHAAHAIGYALAHGYDVDRSMAERVERFCSLENCQAYLQKYFASTGSTEEGLSLNLLAKAHCVRRRLAQALGLTQNAELDKEATTLFQRVMDKFNDPKGSTAASGTTMVEIVSYLLPSLFHFGKQQQFKKAYEWLMSCVQETAETACFATQSSTAQAGFLILQSARRADALALEAIIETEPQSTLCSKLVKGLFAHRVRGHWRTTQENTAILLAVEAYFRTFEKDEPNFEAKAWLGDTFCLKESFIGRSVDTHAVHVPIQTLIHQENGTETTKADTQVIPLVIQKLGAAGRLYYRVGMKYAPRKLALQAYQAGFTVTRKYAAIDRDTDVTFDTSNNVYKVRAGARVRVSLTMSNQTRRYHVALVDYLPAGFEVLNPALKGTGKLPISPFSDSKRAVSYCWWRGPWYEHQNFRDERVEAFASFVSAGVQEFEFIARATQIGDFVVPPARAEEMYSPEVFGRTCSTRVIVAD